MQTSRAFCLSRSLVKRPTKAWEEGESLTSPLLKPTSTVSLDRVTKKASRLKRLSVSRPVKGYYWVLNRLSRFMPVGILSELQQKTSFFSPRNDTGANVTNIELSNEWTVARDKLFKMGEERGKQDIPPRDMPATTGLKKQEWRSDTPGKKLLSWNDINFQYGVGEEETSLNNMGAAGEDIFITDQRGIWSLYRDFYSNFPEKILVNQTVTRIKYSDESVEVTTAEGIIYTAEYALCTFSTGVLESKMVTFDPDLPDWKKEAIFRLRMVYYTKIFLKFPTKFWDDSEFILHLSKQRTGHFPHFQDLDRPGFFNGSTMLLATVTGDVALRIEAQDSSETLEEVMQVLRNMYGDGIPNATGKMNRYYVAVIDILVD